MNKNEIHKTIKNQIKTLFKAPEWSKQAFSSVSTLLQVTSLILIVLAAVFVVNTKQAESKRSQNITFGIEKNLNVFPTIARTKGWAGVEQVFVQDLPDTALYQDFSARNAPYIPQSTLLVPENGTLKEIRVEQQPVVEEVFVTSPEVAEPALDGEVEPLPDTLDATDDTDSVSPETTITEPVIDAAPSSEPEPEPVSEPSNEQPVSWALPSARATLYPLAQLSMTSSTSPLPDTVLPDIQPIEETNMVDMTEETEAALPTAPLSPVSESVPELTLENFNTAPLERGQFINGMNLRLSLAAKLETPATGTAPYLEVFFGKGEQLESVGIVLIDDEVSNAMNGGYYLFALPAFMPVNELSKAKVVIRYYGNAENLDGMFLDAAWLEINSRIITKEDLQARGVAEQLKHLKSPEMSTLLSDQVNFQRDEKPVFNLRYESHRNFIVRGFRSLIGRELVKIDSLQIKHLALGYLGATPNVTVTKEGLVSLDIPEEELEKLRPGSYEVEIVYNEGGKKFTDTFNFQWGILSINPLQSEYETGETAEIAIGALTPNGHTICQTELDLYVTDPAGSITKVPVEESGKCNGNNVIDVPDFSATIASTTAGTYELYLERLDEAGNVLGFTTDTFKVADNQTYSIARSGPTRIFPVAPYEMELTIEANQSFRGVVTERVPSDFIISSTSADIRVDGAWQILSWDVSLGTGDIETVSYGFDAPDLSPFLYNLGPAQLTEDSRTRVETIASTTASSTEERIINEGGGVVFEEHRQWQIASDAVGNMIVYWDNATYIPTGWSCLSCGSGTFYQKFAYGSSTYNTTGGATTHTHTSVGSVNATGGTANSESGGSGGPVINAHTHTYTPTINSVSNLPAYRHLRVIQYTAAAGEPANIPAGAIGVFDATVPTGWTRYSAQDGYYLYGENTPGTTAGSNTHTHTVTGTTGAAGGSTVQSRGGGTQVTSANGTHTHTISSNTVSQNNEPPNISVILGKINATSSPPIGLIAMWTDSVDGGWQDISSAPSAALFNRFLKGSATYGTTGGGTAHTPSDVTGIVSAVTAGTVGARTGATGANSTHTHTVDATNFTSGSNLPPHLTVVFGKRLGNNPLYNQASSRWYTNTNAQTPTDAWPSGATDITERTPVTATSTPIKDGEQIRLRMNVKVTNATSTAGSLFKLQYAAASVNTCSSAGTWTDVGTATSSAIWRGFDNTSVTDGSTISTRLLASSTVSETYQEKGATAATPNLIGLNAFGEWDFVLQHNGAAGGSNYCFRLLKSDGTVFTTYSHYPQLFTNTAPNTPTLTVPFDNEKTASTSRNFFFSASDIEGDKVNYQVQIDNNSDFSSTLVDRNTITNYAEFENQVLISDRPPYIQNNTIKFTPGTTFTNGTTYYWRVRAQDTDASTDWGSWSTGRSFTIDTALTASAWFQTETAQFNTITRSGVTGVGDQVALITGSTTGTLTSGTIDYDDKTLGNAWGTLEFSDTETVGDIKYKLQYQLAGVWTDIPDADLAGNSSGFDSSPVTITSLDTTTYNQIRIVATFTNIGGSPSMQSWAIKWGYRVPTPTITKLFSNEQVGTTTPTFEFSTTDPQNDDLTYQIQWSVSPLFTSSTTRTSGTNNGFSNIEFGGDTNPFISGDTIQFKIQTADALTASTTYWWRVRAKDPAGSNAYSSWSDNRSFTYIPGTSVSTWSQTTKEQFATNILSGTRTLGTDVAAVATTSSEAMLVYGEGNQTAPRYRVYDGSTWGSESTMADVGSALRWAVVEAGTTREEYIAATVGTDADVNAQVFRTGAWGNLQEVTVSMGSVAARGFDVAYEKTSGDAMVAYCDGDADPSYYMWNGSTWTSGGTINLASTNNCEWIELASDPVSDEIILISRDSVGTNAASYELQVWNGSSWGNSTTQGGAKDIAYGGLALMYEESGGQALSISNDGNPVRFEYNSWNGAAWAGLLTDSTISDNILWAEMNRDVGTDAMAMCYIDESSNVGAIRWTGAAWAGVTNLDTVANSVADRGVSCQFETTTGRDGYIMSVYSDATNARYRSYNGATWAAEASISTIEDSASMRLIRTGTGRLLGLFYDDANDRFDFSSWNGSTWSTSQTLETDMPPTSAPYGEPFGVTARNSGRTGTVVTSPAIDFNDGSGPYWKSFAWNDTTPGTSDILYRLQYQTATGSWAYIPNAALPGNVAGYTNSPIDLSALNTYTYNVIRPYAEFSCDGSSNCPTLSDWRVLWAGGINISGTIKQYNESTNVTSGTVAVAIDGVLQSGKTGSINGSGNWSIANVTAFEGDVITVYVTSAANANEAAGITRYDGQGDVSGMTLFERHLTLGSNDATTTPITNSDIALYDYTNSEDLFFNGTGSTLTMCADAGCADAELNIRSGVYYTPGGRFVTHDFENNGTFTAGSFTHEVNGSWDNNATSNMTGSTVTFAATSTTESIDNTGALLGTFNNVTFGTTTGNGTWTLATTLDVDGSLTVTRGTLARSNTAITIAGNLINAANGVWTGLGTTTFDGGAAATWQDANATLQNAGKVVVDGTSKIVTLAGNVRSQTLTIGANDTLDASSSNYDITVMGSWYNQNNFVSRSGEVFFAATTTSRTITTTGDNFYDLTFSGSGSWLFTETTLNVSNDFKVTAGTVTLPTATSTIGGSFTVTGGSFAHNNGTLLFTSGSAETITFLGGAFTNVARNLTFNGAGSWIVTDTNATTTNNVIVQQGTLNFPSGVFAIGGTLSDTGGAFVGGTGTVLFYSSTAKVITMGGSALNNTTFAGTGGSWSFADTSATISGNLIINIGTLTLPSSSLLIGGSYDNNATVTPGTGTVEFNAVATGKTVDFGSSALYNVNFNSSSGGWTVNQNATTTNTLSITSANSWTLSSGRTLSVGSTFTNSVGGAATTWTSSTLALRAGTYSLNTKSNTGDVYATLSIAANTKVSMWNSSASTYAVNNTGYLYSQDHSAVDGNLNIYGAYTRTSGSEFWNYATDFDGTALGGSSRQANVRFASGASAAFSGGSSLNITGISTASTTIANQGSGTYSLSLTGGTLSAGFYQFTDLGGGGLSLLGTVTVPTMNNGSFTVGAAAASALTISSTTINASPSKQITGILFATTTAIAAKNVSQTDGTPASFWRFTGGYGNLYGERYDNDTGNPGSIRFDDSSLVITISGTVYSDAGTTPLVGGTCDGSTQVVRVVVTGGTSYTGSCSNVNGTYSISGITFTGDPTLTIYLDGASGGQRGSVVTRTPTGNITNMDIYANRVIVRHEDTAVLTTTQLAVYDSDNDSDLRFNATTNRLNVFSGTELFIWKGKTFTPGTTVTLAGNAGANSYDGTLNIGNGATFNAYSTTTLTVGGRLVAGSQAVFSAASTTVLMNASTTGKSITATSTLTFNTLTFSGSGGAWNLGANIIANNNINITTGTVTGTGSIDVPYGSLSGNGSLTLGAGTTTLSRSNTLGGTTAWTFNNLKLGNGTVVGTTTPSFTATTTISGRLTIAAAHFVSAGSTKWDFAGTGTVFVEQGTFIENTSTVRYSGAGSNVLSTGYYNLDINSGAGSQTYVGTGSGIVVGNNLTIGGTAASTFDLNTSDPAFDVNGNVTIRSNGTLSASNSGIFTLAGSYTNSGTFTSNNGTLTFDGSGSVNPGNSSFAGVRVTASGVLTFTNNATATAAFRLQSATGFTLSNGATLAVGGSFVNMVGGAATTFTGSTLRLYNGGNYAINNSTTTDTYGTLTVKDTTQIKMWNSSASTYNVDSTASLYSQDHSNTDGELYIFGAYRKTSGYDYWSYANDFNGSALGGSSRKVNVRFASGASALYTGGSLTVLGATTASTTITNQGSGTYTLTVGGSASTSMQYYEVRNGVSAGLTLTGSATVVTLSNGDYEVSQNGFSALTVGGTVITANPAKNMNKVRFALAGGASSGTNVTATGTTVSAWRFANHYGGRDGEAFDVDPGGDPGYVAWDNSAALITVSGRVYSDEGLTVSTVCDGSSNRITLRMAGITSYSTSCNAATGIYTINNVSYGSSDTFVVYIDGVAQKGATVSQDPVSSIADLNIYEDRVIVRHESINPLTIADMAVWDSSGDADIPFTAVDAGTDTLTLPANRKLIVWSAKTFAPGGNVTLSGGGAGASFDGTLELFSNSTWTGSGAEALSVGGSFILNANAILTSSTGTTTFTTTGATRTIDLNQRSLNHVAFTGSGSWTMTDATFTANGNVSQSAGALTLPTGTSTFNGSLVVTGGTFTNSGGIQRFTGTGGKVLKTNGSSLGTLQFAGGNYSMTDVNATTTGSTTIQSGNITLPSGIFSVGRDFKNTGGTITHNTSDLVLRSTVPAVLLASSSDLFSVRFAGTGAYTMSDRNITFTDNFTVNSGASVALASGTIAVGGSLSTPGTFTNSTTTFLFNANAAGKTIDPGTNNFYSVQIAAPSGSYTLNNATTTRNFTLASALGFTQSSGKVLYVAGVFTNSVGGTATNWNGTVYLNSASNYTINSKSTSVERYNTLRVGANTDIRMWNSSATTTTVNSSGSLYSQKHSSVNGYAYLYGDFHITTGTEYWNYAKDFDGTSLTGSERAVSVFMAQNSTTTVDGGALQMIGASGNVTAINRQSAGTYAFAVTSGTLNASHYSYRNLNSNGLNLSGTPTITSLSNGDFELAVNNGTLITLASSTLNANASMVHTGNRFATTSAITGKNVTLSGTTANAWTFSSYTGNLGGESFDVDGATACGSIRWTNSSCLITQQTHYRWRNDDGGTDVPNSEWFNTGWAARKSIRIDNADATTYSNPVVQVFVTYDSDMQADFDDLRFTQDDGITPISYWVGSSTNSSRAEVWLKIPSLPASDTANVYMYYNSPTVTSSSSVDNTFLAADDFDDGNISEYTGQTSLFSVRNNFAYGDSSGLDSFGSETSRSNTGGIFRNDQTVSKGETFRFMKYISTTAGSGDEACAKFGVQTATTNYAVCFEQFGTDRIALVKDVTDNDSSGSATVLGSSTVTFTTGWYEVEVDWKSDNTFTVILYNSARAQVATFNASNNAYNSGGIGFSFWFNYGGWDNVSSRPILTTEPTIRFGAEQGRSGASWKAALNTAATYNNNDIARLRIAIENSGTAISNQLFLLEYAAMGAAPSCEAVSNSSFAAVPIQASCGTSPVCMQSSTFITNGASIADLLVGVRGTYTAGQARENPSNVTSGISINQNQYTEVEYALTPTSNTVDQNLCFRVTKNGTPLDTYLRVARMGLRFDPSFSTPTFNSGANISLLPGTTTRVYATSTVTDLNGYADLTRATTTFYRSGTAGGAACAANNNSCYRSATAGGKCSFINCSGNSCTASCYADIFFHADSTDAGGTYPGEQWYAFMEASDAANGYDFETAPGVELNTLRAINVTGPINYGSLAVSSNTGSTNASTTVTNQGNVGSDLEIQGTDLSDGGTSRIPSNQQKFATSTFTYSTCTSCHLVSSTTPYSLDINIAKPTVATPAVTSRVYWGVAVPFGVNSAPHQGINVFTPVSP